MNALEHDTRTASTLEGKIDILRSIVAANPQGNAELADALHVYGLDGRLVEAMEMFEDENYHDIASLIYDQILGHPRSPRSA